MKKDEKTPEELRAEEAVRKANAALQKARRKKKEELRKEMNRHKYMMGGVIAKYFPDCFDFSELEMNRIIACAFKSRDVQNMVAVVLKERNDGSGNTDEKAYSESDE